MHTLMYALINKKFQLGGFFVGSKQIGNFSENKLNATPKFWQ
ncbi:MAG: hypothetical protein Rpha_0824 [Candidatus Ruthia sp. Apha_13_S6]|nr:hypothetical protein [Candidatus Ruthia sp. Apha_13_S6]